MNNRSGSPICSIFWISEICGGAGSCEGGGTMRLATRSTAEARMFVPIRTCDSTGKLLVAKFPVTVPPD
ncbi:hypothetical protein D3C83_110590 [compost metagenome]